MVCQAPSVLSPPKPLSSSSCFSLKPRSVLMRHVGPELAGDHALPSNLHIVCGDVLNVESLDELGAPTHAYAFWEAVDAKARQAFGKLITKSTTIKVCNI